MASNQPSDNKYGDWVGQKLGAGAFGTVHMWVNNVDRRVIAIKKCRTENHDMAARWQQEMRMIEDMNHPNVVAFIPIPEELTNEYPRRSSLGMEYCGHGDLRRFLYRPDYCCGLPEYHVRDVMCDIGSAIKYLHSKKNMHRDLKPENIVLKDRAGCPGRFQFKVTDLGYAKELNTAQSFAHSFVGTFAYLAPEIARGQGLQYGQFKYHSQVDYWSFGLVIFECITGIRPMNVAQSQTKKENDICFLPDENGKQGYLQHIPKPHSLNPHFERDVVFWLRLMLMLDERKRGGEDNEWYRQLTEKICPTKYIKVLDVASMEVKIFQVEVNAMPQTVLLKIEKELNISQTDLFFLMEGGEPPIATRKILEQLRQNVSLNKGHSESYNDMNHRIYIPEESILYLFRKSNGEWPSYKCKSSPQIKRFLENEDSVLKELGIKRCFHILLFDTLSNIMVGDVFRRALIALVSKVDKMSKQLEEQRNSFLHACEKTAGMVELFNVSLVKDITSSAEQDNSSGICVSEEFSRLGESSKKLSEEWEGQLLEASKLITGATEELIKRTKLHPNLNALVTSIQKEFTVMSSIYTNATKFYTTFKKEIKAAERDGQSNTAQKQQIREFKSKLWLKVKEFVEDILKPKSHLRSIMRFLIDHHTRLESMYFKIMDKMQRMTFIQDNIKEKQRDRQHILWNMLQYMKDVYNTAVQYERDDQPEQELAQELNNLRIFAQRFVNDPDFHSVIRLSVEELQPGSGATTNAASQNSHETSPSSEAREHVVHRSPTRAVVEPVVSEKESDQVKPDSATISS